MATKDLVANLYNPHEQSKAQLIASFVARRKLFERLFEDIKTAPMQYPEQHILIEGQRGSGKTTLLLRLSYAIENDEALNSWLIPVVFKEEAYYGIADLPQLWTATAQLLEDQDDAFAGLAMRMAEADDGERDYERVCFEMLVNALEQQNKKTILFIDNFGELLRGFDAFDDTLSHRFREVLMTCSYLRVVGATSVTLEAFFRYNHAFYEFFKTFRLKELDRDETHLLLLELAKDNQEKDTIRHIIEQQPGRIESLRLLTGGVIRTIVLLFEILTGDQDGASLTDLEQILDRVTPLYKHRMDDLEPHQRPVVNAIALSWDAISPNTIARRTRRNVDDIKAVLDELAKVFLVQRALGETQRDLYYLSERFFNIWYLMRVAPKHSRIRVIWLVRFLENWYEPEELRQRARQHIQDVSRGDFHPKAAFYLTEALSRTGKLDLETEYEMKSATRELLLKKDWNLVTELSPSDQELLEKAYDFGHNEDYENALKYLLSINNKDGYIHYGIGCTYVYINDYEKAEQFYLKAIEQGNLDATNDLGVLYDSKLNDYEKAEQFYLKAIEQGDVDAMYNLALLYDAELKDYEKAEQFYLKAAELGDVDAIFNLGLLYNNELKNYEKAEQFYFKAAEQDHASAMNNLGLLYKTELKDYEKAEQFYLKAIEQGNANAMYNLGLLYKTELKNRKKAEQFYLKAIEQGHASAMNSLAHLYFQEKIKKQESLQYAKRAIETEKNSHNANTLACVHIWHNQFEQALHIAEIFMTDETFYKTHEQSIILYLMLLLAKDRYTDVSHYFDMEKFNLKERFKPLYYALLYLSDHPDYQKQPPELAKPVHDLIARVQQLAIYYA